MKKRTFLILLSILLCSACIEQKVSQVEQTWDIDLSQANASLRDAIKGINFIPLETIEESLLFGVDKLVVKNDLIYIGDFYSKKIVVYDKTGKIKFVINRRGEGPEEYIDMKSFAVDKQFIYIVDNHRHLLNLYNCQNGNFVETRKLPFVTWDMEILPNGNFIFTYIPFKEGSGPNMKQERYKIFITDPQLNIKKRLFEYNKKDFEFIGKMVYFTTASQGIVFNSMASDDLYIFSETDSIRHIAINFKNKIPSQYRQKLDEIDKGEYNYLIKTPLLCKDYMIFLAPDGEIVLDYLYNSRRGILSTNDRVNAYKGLLTPQTVYQDKVISYLDNYDYYKELVDNGFERASHSIEEHLKEEKPILMLYAF